MLFAGQYAEGESGWVYHRFRFYDPVTGVYGAQDPLGVTPRIAGAQGYVDHALVFADPFALQAHPRSAAEIIRTNAENGRKAEVAAANENRELGLNIQEQVSFRSEGYRSRAYQAFLEDDILNVVEVKTGGNDLTENQIEVYRALEGDGATSTQGSGNRVFGRRQAPTEVTAQVWVQQYPDPTDLTNSRIYSLTEWNPLKGR